jgi:tetratricopeptide (TPR) repeat protein
LPKEIYQVGDEYAKALNYDKAGILYQYVIANWPDSEYEMWAKSGIIKLDICLGNDANVQPALDELIADFNDQPALPEAVFVIGEQYYYKAFEDPNKCRRVKSEEYLKKSRDIWEKVVVQCPESKSIGLKHAQYFTAVCYRRLGEYEKALIHYQKVVDNWPDYQYAWSAQSLVGSCYKKLRDLGKLSASEANPKIEQAYKAVLENYPGSAAAPSSSLKLAHLYLELGQNVEAAVYFEIFLATARPNDPRIESVEARLEELKGEEK